MFSNDDESCGIDRVAQIERYWINKVTDKEGIVMCRFPKVDDSLIPESTECVISTSNRPRIEDFRRYVGGLFKCEYLFGITNEKVNIFNE